MVNVSATAVPAVESRRKPYAVLFGLPVGMPQIAAGFLLAMFLAQSLWIAVHTPLRPNEVSQVQQGQLYFAGNASVRPLLVPIAAAAAVIGSGPDLAGAGAALPFRGYPPSWRWRARLPFLLAGLLLGASLWYVARRLFGNVGGFIALGLYVFTPALLQGAAMAQGAMIAAWAAFGIVFTSIAVAHTLYAPREVVVWNWKRILLLGISLSLAVAVQPALLLVAAVALGFMLYLAPGRRRESLIIFGVACIAAALLLLALYSFHPSAITASFTGFRLREFSPELFARSLTWSLLAVFFLRMPAVFLLLIASLFTFASWKRPRYFGVTAPLLTWGLLMALGIALPHLGGYVFFLVALPFAFVMIAGVFTDVLESKYAALALGPLAGILLAHAAVNLMALGRIR